MDPHGAVAPVAREGSRCDPGDTTRWESPPAPPGLAAVVSAPNEATVTGILSDSAHHAGHCFGPPRLTAPGAHYQLSFARVRALPSCFLIVGAARCSVGGRAQCATPSQQPVETLPPAGYAGRQRPVREQKDVKINVYNATGQPRAGQQRRRRFPEPRIPGAGDGQRPAKKAVEGVAELRFGPKASARPTCCGPTSSTRRSSSTTRAGGRRRRRGARRRASSSSPPPPRSTSRWSSSAARSCRRRPAPPRTSLPGARRRRTPAVRDSRAAPGRASQRRPAGRAAACEQRRRRRDHQSRPGRRTAQPADRSPASAATRPPAAWSQALSPFS